MAEIISPVYRENRFSVDFEETPMFAGVKRGSVFWDQDELVEKLGLRSDVKSAVSAVDYGQALDFTYAQLGFVDEFDDYVMPDLGVVFHRGISR